LSEYFVFVMVNVISFFVRLIETNMLTALRKTIRDECTSRKHVLRTVSKLLRAASSECDTVILVTINKRYGAIECVGGRRKEYVPLLNDEYVVLRTADGCDLSLIGLSSKGGENIEITSDTVVSQQKKGYNGILRAVAVMIAFVERKPLRSEISNTLSAYTLMKMFQTTLIRANGETTIFASPLSAEDSSEAMRDSRGGRVLVRPTVVNLDLATSAFVDAMYKLRCATHR
jgi:hypothetical protein